MDDCAGIRDKVSHLDTRVSVLETQVITAESKIDSLANKIDSLMAVISVHVEDDAKRLNRVLLTVIVTLLTLIGSILFGLRL